MKNTAALFGVLLYLFSISSARSAETKAPEDFGSLVDQYFDFYFSFHPTEATAAGFHQYDAKLEDYSSVAVEREVGEIGRAHV